MTPVTGLNAGRLALGVLCVARPSLAAGVFGLEADSSPHVPFLTRIFGVREIAVAGATLLAQGPARRDLTVVGVAVDLADAASSIVGLRAGEVGLRGAAPLVLAGLGAAAAGLVELAPRG